MAERRHVLFVGAAPNQKDLHAGGQATAALGLVDYAQANDIALTIIDSSQASFPVPPVSQRVGRALARLRELFGHLRSGQVDGAIIFASAGMSFYEKSLMALVCRVFRVPSFLFVRSGHFMTDCQKSTLRRRLNAWALRIPNRLGVQGEGWVRFYRDLGVDASRIEIVRSWLSPGRTVATEPRVAGSPLTFVFVGWLVRKKGVLEIIDAVAASPLLQTCRVALAGGGDLMDEATALVAEQRLDQVALLGWQSAEQIDALLGQADVFVLPTYAEGFPNALLEAMSQGLPAVVSPVGAIPDSARDGENARWVTPGDAASLRTAMEAFALAPELVERYSRRSLELVAQLHDRDANCARIFDFFAGDAD